MSYQIKSNNDYLESYQKSIEDPEKFWDEIASNFVWRKKWNTTLNWEFNTPDVEWFGGGELNITENCLDRHIEKNANGIALIWEPNEIAGKVEKYTYLQLLNEVCRMANVLKSMGVRKGDRVCIYMPMIPELAFAVLACARIGAIHSVVFAGFSSNAIADRIIDSDCAYVITSNAMQRGEKWIPLKPIVDEAILRCPSILKVLVVDRLKHEVSMRSGRDYMYSDLVAHAAENCTAEIMKSEDPLFILYTSGSTGKPKGVVHSCGGYMVYVGYSFQNVFQYEKEDIYWCTADIGWVTGHSYILYGPLLNGATTLMFEGIPTFPDAGRFWNVIDKHKVNIFYTAPTAIRSLMCFDESFVIKYNLSSLKTLGTVGEPINEEAWHWYYEKIGKGNCAIADTWWQTETGGIMISALSGISEIKPTYAGLPLPGIQPCLLNKQGKEIKGNNVEGFLCIKFPWPSMIRTTWGDHERCRLNYFSAYPNYYFTGDGAKRNEEGMYRIIGRVDDVINVSGHRFGTAEVENAINESQFVIESAVVGYPHDIKGQGIYAFAILSENGADRETIRLDILKTVENQIGKIARPDKIQFVSGLPKTRSGKIMRRILRKVAEGELNNLGDTSTLLDPPIVQEIIQNRL